MIEALDRAMETAVADRVFPGGVLLWAVGKRVCYHQGVGSLAFDGKAPVDKDTVYDLASLTKPLATALAVGDLVKKGNARVSDRLSDLIPETAGTPKGGITLEMLLGHTSGLPAHRDYFRQVGGPGSNARWRMRQLILDEPLVSPPGDRECYSDIGYMILAWVVENLSGQRLDAYVRDHLYTPLGIGGLGFIDLDRPKPDWTGEVPPTMDCPWRKRIIRGEVEDENAWAAGGIDGHAGLFGNAAAVHTLCAEILGAVEGEGTGILDPYITKKMTARVAGRVRTPGFDTPSGECSAAGQYLSPKAFGHLGFTGTSFWIDPETGLIIVLLTNRVHPSRENLGIKKFRPLIHDLVFKAFQRF